MTNAIIISSIQDLIIHLSRVFNVDLDDADLLARDLRNMGDCPDYGTDWAEYLADKPGNWGNLYDYRTGEYIREATAFEWSESVIAAETDGGSGTIDTGDGRICYVA